MPFIASVGLFATTPTLERAFGAGFSKAHGTIHTLCWLAGIAVVLFAFGRFLRRGDQATDFYFIPMQIWAGIALAAGVFIACKDWNALKLELSLKSWPADTGPASTTEPSIAAAESELKATRERLERTRASLDLTDSAAVAHFNNEVAAYNFLCSKMAATPAAGRTAR